MDVQELSRFLDTGPLLDAAVPGFAALACGLALGAERETNRHAAGLRTLALICLGSCLFTMAGRWVAEFPVAADGSVMQVDPGRLASYVIAGVGFLGAGPIITRSTGPEGLTTAASIWSTAAIGVLAGFGHVQVAVVATLVILFVLWGLRTCAARLRGDPSRRGEVLLVVEDHLALTRTLLLLEQNPLVVDFRVEPGPGRWRVHLVYRGDELSVGNLLETIACIRGTRGIRTDEREETGL
jgi:uncharacterized membrane protein YhiD involved in acid resistance